MTRPLSYDVIGDIHGQAGKLDRLLQRLGYGRRGTGWAAPEGRRAVFVGDLIDRGPEQVRTVETVRAMVDAGVAHVVSGNHELNAIGFVSPELDGHGRPTGRTLRTRTPDHIHQHAEFLQQVGEGSAKHAELVGWFRTLPLALDLGGIRVVHAWWHAPYLDAVAQAWDGAIATPATVHQARAMDDGFLRAAFARDTPLWSAVEGLTKGQEIALPEGSHFHDNHGLVRHHVRTRWWDAGHGTYRQVALVPHHQRDRLPDVPVQGPAALPPLEGAPVFVGHHWMHGTPRRQTPKVACVDWSAGLGGSLVAYRWDGEPELDDAKFVAVA